jgi:hypothetical protein
MTDPSTRPIFDTLIILGSLAFFALACARFAGLSDGAALIHPGPDRWYLDGPGMPEGWEVRDARCGPVACASPSPIGGQPAGAPTIARERLAGHVPLLDDLPDHWPVIITAGAFAGQPGVFLGEVGGFYHGETFYFVGLSGGRVTAVGASWIEVDGRGCQGEPIPHQRDNQDIFAKSVDYPVG